jgi:hypothetical protein
MTDEDETPAGPEAERRLRVRDDRGPEEEEAALGGDAGAERGGLAVGGEVTPPKNLGGRPLNPIARLKREAQAELDRRACEAGGELFDRLLAKALGGGDDALPALKMLLDRVWPARAKALQEFRLPPTHDALEVGEAMDAVLAGVSTGELAAEDGAKLVAMLEARLKAYEAAELPARVEELMKVAAAYEAASLGSGVGGRA